FAWLWLEIAQDRTRERITEPGRVGEDVPNGGRLGRRAEPIGAGRRVERFEDLQVCKLRQILFDRIVETEPALLDELHGRRRRDRLGHRGAAEQGVGGGRAPGRIASPAEGPLIKDASAQCVQRGETRSMT